MWSTVTIVKAAGNERFVRDFSFAFCFWYRGQCCMRSKNTPAATESSTFRSVGRFEVVRRDQCRRWRAGECVLIESYLKNDATLAGNSEGVMDLIYQEMLLREELGESASIVGYQRRFPTLASELKHLGEVHRAFTCSTGKQGLTPGQRIAHFLIECCVGSGGMGEVYLARDTTLDRPVALKVLPRRYSPSLRSRLLAEANVSARVQHPAIATFFESGVADGESYIAMEYVSGRTLRERLRQGPLPWREALSIIISVLEALTHAHAAGIVHCDVKPENIMVAGDGAVKLLDFGLSKRLLVGPHNQTRSQAAAEDAITGGTLGYMAPELLDGTPVDERCDVFALGAVLFELIVGHPAFHGVTPTPPLAAVLRGDLKLVDDPRLSERLACVVRIALSRNICQRYRRSAELLDNLRDLESEAVALESSSEEAPERNAANERSYTKWSRLQKGGFREAESSVKKAIQADAPDGPGLCRLAALHALQFTYLTDPSELDLALAYAQQALVVDPCLCEARSWLGYAMWRQGRADEALQIVTAAQSLGAASQDSIYLAHYIAGCILMSMSRHRDAIEQLRQSVELNPDVGWAWAGLALSHLAVGKERPAIRDMRRAVELEKQGVAVPTVGVEGVLGELLRRVGQFDEARFSCMRGIDAVEQSDHIYRDTMRGVCLCSLGRTAVDQGDLPAAETAFRQAVAHLQGRSRALGAGHLIVQAKAGLSRATGDGRLLSDARRTFMQPEKSSFHFFFTCSDEVTSAQLSLAAEDLAG